MEMLTKIFNLVEFSSGRRIYALEQVRQVALARGAPVLVARINRAVADDRETLELDRRWAERIATASYEPEVIELDLYVDQVLIGIRDVAKAYCKGMQPGSHKHRVAERLLTEVFPNGLEAIISLPYIEQVAMVEVILARLQGELAAVVTDLMLTHVVDRLAVLTARYRQLVRADPRECNFAAVRAARERGQNNLLEIIALIVGTYHDHSDPDHIVARRTLLAPILEQDRIIRAHLRLRGGVDDLDPIMRSPGRTGFVH